MLTIQRLTLDQISLFKSYAYPDFRSELHKMVESPNHLLLGAMMFKQPVGLIVAYLPDDLSFVSIQSIFVSSRFRNMGIARNLLLTVIEHSTAYAQIHIRYFANIPERSYLEKALHKVGFDHPDLDSMYYKVDVAALALAPWIGRCKQSPELKMLPWKQINEQQRQDLKEKRYFDYREGLSPFIQEEAIEASASLALQRDDGAIMGWIIYHRYVEHAVLCRSLFIAESFQDRGLGLTMIGRSIELMMEAKLQTAVFQVVSGNGRMLRIAEKMIMPYQTKQTEQTEFRQARFIREQQPS